MKTVTLPPRRGPVKHHFEVHDKRVTLSDGRIIYATSRDAAVAGVDPKTFVVEVAVWTGSKWLVVES